MTSKRLTITILSILMLGASARVSEAQLGSGWTRYSPTKKIHLDDTSGLRTFGWTASKSVCSPACAEYRYDSATDTETFRVIDNRSNRSEIRLQNEYSSGRRQFQGYVTFDAPLNDESLFQIFGSTSGATQLMIRGFSGSGGSIRGGGKTLATGIYGVERRINVIHTQGGKIQMYVNGSLKHQITDNENVSNYHKYGCYGTLRTGAATVRWRAACSFKDGNAPVAALEAEPEDPEAEVVDDLDQEEMLGEELNAIEGDDPAAGDAEVGGCTTGGAPGAAIGLVVLGLALARRRR